MPTSPTNGSFILLFTVGLFSFAVKLPFVGFPKGVQQMAFSYLSQDGEISMTSNVYTGEVIEMPQTKKADKQPRCRSPPFPFIFYLISKKETEER